MSRCVWALAVMLIGASLPIFGQENKDEIIQKLISRVEALEREVAALKQGEVPKQPDAPEPAAATPKRQRAATRAAARGESLPLDPLSTG